MVESDGSQDDEAQIGRCVVAGVAERDGGGEDDDDQRGHQWPLEPS